MGQEHLRNLAVLRKRRGFDISVSAIVEPDAQMREQTLELIRQLELGDPIVHSSHTELAVGDCDAIVLVSPNFTHFAVLKDLFKLQVAILSEKPLCTEVEQCAEIESLVGQYQHPFWVAMEYRYMPPTRRFIEQLSSGVVGSLQSLSITEHRFPFLTKVGDWNRFSRNTGGTLVEKCCHHFDLMRLISQSEPTRIYASGAMDVNHLDERYNGETPDILDNAFVIVDFANGVRASLDLCMFAEGSDPQEQLTAIGDVAKLQANISPAKRHLGEQENDCTLLLQPRSGDSVLEVVGVDDELAEAGAHHGSTFYQHEKFAEAVLFGAAVEVTVADGAAAVRMGAAAQQSLATGEAVKLVN